LHSLYSLKELYCITNDAIRLMKENLCAGVLHNVIINNNDEQLVTITSESYKLINKYFTDVILLDCSSSKIVSKSRDWKPPKRSKRLGRRKDARDYKNQNGITRTRRTDPAMPTHSWRARRKITMVTLKSQFKSQLSSARIQTSIATRTSLSTSKLLNEEIRKNVSLKYSRDNERSKKNDACLSLRVSRRSERELAKQMVVAKYKNDMLTRTIVVMEDEIEEKVEVSHTILHNTQLHFKHTPKLTSFNIFNLNLQVAVAQTTAVLNGNHNKIMNKKDSKHKDLMRRHKTSHEKSLKACSKKAEKIATATEKEVKETEKAKKKEWSETMMKVTKQSKLLVSQVQTTERSALARDKFHQMELNKMQNAHKKQKLQMKSSQNTILKTKSKFHTKQMKVSEQTK